MDQTTLKLAQILTMFGVQRPSEVRLTQNSVISHGLSLNRSTSFPMLPETNLAIKSLQTSSMPTQLQCKDFQSFASLVKYVELTNSVPLSLWLVNNGVKLCKRLRDQSNQPSLILREMSLQLTNKLTNATQAALATTFWLNTLMFGRLKTKLLIQSFSLQSKSNFLPQEKTRSLKSVQTTLKLMVIGTTTLVQLRLLRVTEVTEETEV